MIEKLAKGGGFIVSGTLAFLTDAAVLALLTRRFGLDPFTARLFAILAAMTVGYFAHRRLSFRVLQAPSPMEFAKFMTVAAGASLANYAVYAGVLLLAPSCDPLLALVIASSFAMIASYFGLSRGVFTKRGSKP